jgi:uncharacterized protein with PhoU and TrkA domain
VLAIQRGSQTLARPQRFEQIQETDVLALLAQEDQLHTLPQRHRDAR